MRAENWALVIDVEYLNADGSHHAWEEFDFPGQWFYRYRYILDQDGDIQVRPASDLLAAATKAPAHTDETEESLGQHIPDGFVALRDETEPDLDSDFLLRTIRGMDFPQGYEGRSRGRGQLKDMGQIWRDGAIGLAALFAGLVGSYDD